MTATELDPKAFHDGLVKHGHIVPVGVLGIFGRGRRGFDRGGLSGAQTTRATT